ncbi:MAG: recombinase zinc beta ribbon domain-containing protein, partial [Anaerotignum sp.]|nr:recombinase zinc beta ribbon domain-containing protein [Anaerotignum sp.]
CGGAYVGHTSTNTKGYENMTYVCGTKYRNHTCSAKNLAGLPLEEFVVVHVKNYIRNMDFEKEADEIMKHLTQAAPDAAAEKKELKEINTKLNNGVKAILNGLEFPELQEEMDRLRVRKSELEDVIAHADKKTEKVDREKLIAYMKKTAEELEANPKAAIRELVKIYAHADGSCTVNIGVHIGNCGDRI